ncbi:MAG TPA: peptidylprolyl isomerase [Candidatus Magasanikbacteria bacterium]|nr:peptidylprolyl isomerase [Candidatus Magasanikbacteria bacterium]
MENINENQAIQGENSEVAGAVVLPTDSNLSKNKKMFLYGLSFFVLTVLIAFCVLGFFRVRSGATDGFAYFTAKFLHLPLMSLNEQKIPYTDYLDDLKAIKTMKEYEENNNENLTAETTEEQMSDQVIWRLANNVMVSQIAKTMDVKIEKKDVEELKKQVLQQFESEGELEKELLKRYGWNMSAYEKKVIKPFILQSKVGEKIQTDKTVLDNIYKQAEKVLEQIKNGASFEEMASIYGSDSTKETGGDLGWFGKGEMVPQFEDAVFALKKGQLSEQLVETEFGYHIVKVYDTKIERVKDESGKWVNASKVKASHILFSFPTFEQYMSEYLKKAEIKFYSKIHNPFQIETSNSPIVEQ